MSGPVDQVAAQLDDELGAAASRLGAIVGPMEHIEWPQTIAGRCGLLAAQLCQDDDDRLAAQTVIDVLIALWPHGAPEDHDPGWWQTPLGRMCARSLGRNDAETVTYSVAAAILGTYKGRLTDLVRQGKLDRHPDGGLLRGSVLRLVASQRGEADAV